MSAPKTLSASVGLGVMQTPRITTVHQISGRESLAQLAITTLLMDQKQVPTVGSVLQDTIASVILPVARRRSKSARLDDIAPQVRSLPSLVL